MTAPIYRRARKTAERLLAPNRMGQGALTLTRRTRVSGTNSWDDPTWTTQTETLKGAVRGVSGELVGTPAGEGNGAVIVATDRQAICAIPAMQYQPGDVLTVDGVPVTLLSVSNIPAAGEPAAVRFVIR